LGNLKLKSRKDENDLLKPVKRTGTENYLLKPTPVHSLLNLILSMVF
jgi:hypothetical protein